MIPHHQQAVQMAGAQPVLEMTLANTEWLETTVERFMALTGEEYAHYVVRGNVALSGPMLQRWSEREGLYLEVDLTRELEALHREPEWKTGHNAKTLVKFDTLRVVFAALKAGSRIPPHQTEGRISIHTVQGRIQVRAEGRTFNLNAGSLVALDQGVRHDVEALEDSAFLLTIAWPPET